MHKLTTLIVMTWLTTAGAALALDADFVGDPRGERVPFTVSFLDASSGTPNGWDWSFGDGGWSDEENPNYTYTIPGLYTVALTAHGKLGETDTEIKPQYIVALPRATFNRTPPSGSAPLTVWFENLTVVDNMGTMGYFWNFGDGSVSFERSPTHTYTSPGNYLVILQVNCYAGSDIAWSTVVVKRPVVQGLD